MKQRGTPTVGLILAATLCVSPLLPGEKKNPVVGTWKLDVDKSKYSSGSLPKSATRTVEAQADGEKTSYEEVKADGSQESYSYTASYDEKDYPITGMGANWREELLSGADTITVRRAGSNAYAFALKKSGQVVVTMRGVVSKDGKLLTLTANGADAKGQPTAFVTVWDKQ